MNFVSWNVNGLRAAMNKGFKDFFCDIDADIFAIQETKMQEEQKAFDFPGYHEYWNCALKKGYSGTLIYTKIEPLKVNYGLEDGKYNDEGRIITLEFENYFFVTAYVPNSQRELTRLDYRMQFEDDFREYLCKLDEIKPVIVCGDLNVAHR
ncbi:MAG TPA: exodeoxyribonuclease III, partial [Bacilli bacterium]